VQTNKEIYCSVEVICVAKVPAFEVGNFNTLVVTYPEKILRFISMGQI
jgi:hypothetical protein